MSSSPQHADADFVYEGDELALFAHAVHWKTYFARALRPYVRGDVLEVGAGIGGTTRQLCDGSQNSWTALEPDAAMADEMRAKLRAEPLPIEDVTVEACALEDLGADRTFDTILYIDVLEHIEHDREELAAATEHLRPGGNLVVLSPAHQSLFTPFDAAIGHFRRYDARSLRSVTPRGLRETRVFYLDSVGMLASLGNRLLLKASMPTPKQLKFWDSVLVPLSRVVDPLTFHRLGKTVIGVWTKPAPRG
jgi:SAM-dependent methyltransferase